MPSHQPPPSLRTWEPVLSPAGAPRREGSAQQLSWALNGRWVGTQLGSCCRRGCVRTANVWGRGACGHQPPASATPPPTFAFGKTLADCAPIARPLQARVSHGLDGDRAVRRGGLMNAPSSESRGIECSLLELYEPNEHAPSMSAFDILRDLAKRSVTMQDALSDTDRVAPPPNPRLTSGYPRGSAHHGHR